MASQPTLLDTLRRLSSVDCDTLDVQVVQEHGPFSDCTSNQAIACFELKKAHHENLVQRAVSQAEILLSEFKDLTIEELAVELSMVSLALLIAPHITGFVHVQTNPFYSYSTAKTVENAHRIRRLFQHQSPEFDISRICIKIPSTWEGLQACRLLEAAGVTTLATTLFTLEQAALAGEVGCHYIAPYVNELKVHFVEGHLDNHKALDLCVSAQHYYEQHGLATKVLAASLTSTHEIMALAGVGHITVPPGLLRELALTKDTDSQDSQRSLFDVGTSSVQKTAYKAFVDDESAFRIAFTRSNNGANEGKLIQAINIFCDMQTELQSIMTQAKGSRGPQN